MSIIVVLGMHRSGTSVITRSLQRFRVDFGSRPHGGVLGDNNKGCLEDINITSLDEALLEFLGENWHSLNPDLPEMLGGDAVAHLREQAITLLQRKTARVAWFGMSDPRVARLLPFWTAVFADLGIDVRYLLAIRNPLSVAASLAKRNGFAAEKSLYLWLQHVIPAVLETTGSRRTVLDFDRLMASPEVELRRVATDLGIADRLDQLELSAFCSSFLYDNLQHARFSVQDLADNPAVPKLATEVFETLTRVAGGEQSIESADVASAFQGFSDELERLRPALRIMADTDATTSRLRQALAEGQVQIEGLMQSVAERGRDIANLRGLLTERENRLAKVDHVIGSARSKVQHLLQERDLLTHRLWDIQGNASWPLARPLLALGRLAPTLVRGAGAFAKLIYWSFGLRLSGRLRLRQRAKAILSSGLFDVRWYVENNPDVLVTGIDPLLHWLEFGWREGRSPSALFDCHWYLLNNPDVVLAAFNPLEHYLEYGGSEGRDPHPLFDSDWYLSQNPDVSEARVNPLCDFLRGGGLQGRDPHPLFDSAWYQERYPEVSEARLNPLKHYLERAIIDRPSPHPLFDTDWYLRCNPDIEYALEDPLTHYLNSGAWEGRDPHPLFDSSWYLERYPEVAAAKRNPLLHYVEEGAKRGYDPHPLFHTSWYLEKNPDVLDSGANPLTHFVTWGAWDGRNPNPLFDTAWYLRQHPDLAHTRINPLVHYLECSLSSQLDPSPGFDAGIYAASLPGAARLGLTPLGHFLTTVEARATDHGEMATTGAHAETPGAALMEPYLGLYKAYVEAAGREPSGEYFTPESDVNVVDANFAVRLIAFYLPQFHPIPENDEWWGRGFTEWTNVSKAVPQFQGHYQPHLPGELGFYDLRLPEVQRRQAQLAKQYGIYGFCYHYYWFAGRRLLERPLDQALAEPTMDMPFCICWANENWTRRWDGQDNEVLLAQDHSPESDLQFIDDVLPLLKDPRYIALSGRPLIIVYRVNLLPQPLETVKRWRTRCRELGVADPYLVAAQTFGVQDPRPFGFDGAVEFPPHNMSAIDVTEGLSLFNTAYQGRVYSYRSVVENAALSLPPYPLFRCAFPGWDNEARKPGGGHVYVGATPRLYSDWLGKLVREAHERPETEERLVFVNAWNEWAEGAHLEPDRRFGYAYLQATAETLRRYGTAGPLRLGRGALRWLSREPAMRESKIAVIAHVFYPELWEELASHLGNITEPFDLFVTIVREEDANYVESLRPENVNQLFIGVVVNRGRDIAPFLGCLDIVRYLGYEVALKIHTKGTSTSSDGDLWRTDMHRKVLGSTMSVARILELLRSDGNIGLIAPTGHLLPAEYFWGRHGKADLNLIQFERLVSRVGLPRRTHGFSFPAGSVYWFRPDALGPLANLVIDEEDFPPETGQRDGTIAHALERMVGLASSTDGWRMEVTAAANNEEPATEWTSQRGEGRYPFACATWRGEAMAEVWGIR